MAIPVPSNDPAVAKEILAEAQRVAVLTGAGISTDSGIPDFRGPKGIWTLNPGAEEWSSISSYRNFPEMRKKAWDVYTDPVWATYGPNKGHYIIADLGDRLLHIATQNIDALHQKSGVPSEKISELHGNLRETVCMDCGEIFPAFEAKEPVPCLTCEGQVKPNLIFFGEQLPSGPYIRSETAAASCDAYLIVGTTLQVWPAADLPVVAKRGGAPVIIVNGDETSFDDKATVVLHADISTTLEAIL